MTDYFLCNLMQTSKRWRKIIICILPCFIAFCLSGIPIAFANDHTIKHSSNTHHKKIFHATKSQSHKKTKHLAKKVRVMIPNHQPDNSGVATHLLETKNETIVKRSFVASMEERLVHFVHQTVTTLRYSMYKLGGSHFDPSRGIYIVDCSSYIDYVLKHIYPHAYSSLVSWSGSEKPTTYDYYNFFNELSSNSKKHYWDKIDDVETLRPGDVLVFRYTNSFGDETGGHMMIVMDKPVAIDNAYLVRVADSAATGHTEDTRRPSVSGIGIGTIVLKIDPKTYQPTAFAWRIGSRLKNVNVAMARPIDVNQTMASTETANTETHRFNLVDSLKSIFKA